MTSAWRDPMKRRGCARSSGPRRRDLRMKMSLRRRQGVGARLLIATLGCMRERGNRVATLTTFRHLPWNAPFYAHHGFRIVEREALTTALAARLEKEADEGLNPDLRVAIRLDLDLDALRAVPPDPSP